MPTLNDPIRIGDLDLPNRVLMAPLTRSRATDDRVRCIRDRSRTAGTLGGADRPGLNDKGRRTLCPPAEHRADRGTGTQKPDWCELNLSVPALVRCEDERHLNTLYMATTFGSGAVGSFAGAFARSS